MCFFFSVVSTQACEQRRRTATTTVEQRRHAVDEPCQGMGALNNTVRNRRRACTPNRRRRCTATTRTTAARTTTTSSSSILSNSTSNSFTARNSSRLTSLGSGLRPATTTIILCPGTRSRCGGRTFIPFFMNRQRVNIYILLKGVYLGLAFKSLIVFISIGASRVYFCYWKGAIVFY